MAPVARAAALLVFATGCGAPSPVDAPERPAAPPRLAPAPSATAAAATAPAARPELCPPGARGILFAVEDHALACKDEHRDCSATVPIGVVNCTDTPVVLEQIWLRAWKASPNDGYIQLTFDHPTLQPGEARGREVHVSSEQHRELEAYGWRSAAARERGEPLELLARGSVTITNPALRVAQAECRACNGIWGPVGMMGTLTCNCATKDAGETCDDGDDCEGTCLFEKMLVLEAPQAPRCDPGGACSAKLGLGRPQGKCSATRMVFGCKSRIARGASKEPPVTLPARAPFSCVD